MSELKKRIQEDAKHALKAGEPLKRLTLNILLTAIKNKEIEKRTRLGKSGISEDLEEKSELMEDEVISVISSEAKKRKEAIEAYQKGGREELAVKERDELTILEVYLPKQLSEEEIRTLVAATINELGIKDAKEMGRVIGAVMTKTKGKTDGQIVSKIVREELNKQSAI